MSLVKSSILSRALNYLVPHSKNEAMTPIGCQNHLVLIRSICPGKDNGFEHFCNYKAILSSVNSQGILATYMCSHSLLVVLLFFQKKVSVE